MTSFKILTVNCRGIRDQYNRRDIFDYLRNKNFSIYCFQDPHFTKDDSNLITSQWGYTLFHSPGTRDSRGVAILFNNNFEYTIIKEKRMILVICITNTRLRF